MKKDLIPSASKFRTSLLLLLMSLLSTSVLLSQIPAKVEKAIDDYYTEMVKVYKIIESEEVQIALQKIDDLKPSIEKKAKVLANLVNGDPDLLEYLDSENYMEDFQDKPYFKDIMTITQSEAFSTKFMGSSELQSKVEEVSNIIEEFTDTEDLSKGEESDFPPGVAFAITITGNNKYSGTHKIVADFEEGAVAYIDDLEYLRVDINGEADGKEAVVSFFVDNNGTGRQEWATEGHFVFELMDQEGELLISLWGSEEMGYFDIITVDGPGGFVSGKVKGACKDGSGDSDDTFPIEADFKVRYIELDY